MNFFFDQHTLEAIQDGLAPDRDAYLAGVVKDVEHLDGVVSDVFALARLEGGSFELRPEWVDMAELADELAIIRSMTANFPEHATACYYLHSGLGLQGRPLRP